MSAAEETTHDHAAAGSGLTQRECDILAMERGRERRKGVRARAAIATPSADFESWTAARDAMAANRQHSLQRRLLERG